MAKIKYSRRESEKEKVDEEEEVEDDEQFDDDDLDKEEQEEIKETRGRPRKQRPNPAPNIAKKPVKRFEAFHQAEVVGVRDTESEEIIAQQFESPGTAMAFAEIFERLERIENTLGSMLGD